MPKCLYPGVYEVGDELQIIVSEVAAHLGVSLAWLEANIDEILQEVYADAPVEIVTSHGPPAWRGRG